MSERWKYQLKIGLFWGLFMTLFNVLFELQEKTFQEQLASSNFYLRAVVVSICRRNEETQEKLPAKSFVDPFHTHIIDMGPCKIYYSSQAIRRKQNSNQRKPIKR